MKKLAVIFVCMFVLLSAVANAADRDYYKLEKYAMVFVNVLHINRYVELIAGNDNIATEYFNDLLSRKLAMQPCEELIVYKFDKFLAAGEVICYRVKLQKGAVVGFIDTNAGIVRSVKLQDDTILGWVFENSLKRTKQK